ncbi:hypothetical protein LCGC14_2957710, partial [marine sediment metagenome]
MLHIIVPTCLADEHVCRTFSRTLREHTTGPCRGYEVINDDSLKGVSIERVRDDPVDWRVYIEPRRIGYVNACNVGYRLADPADDDLVVVLNDDLVFEGDWLNPLAAAI